MVGIAHDSSTTPVALAQAAMRQPHATVNGVLSQMYQSAPPFSDIPHLTDIAARPGQWVRYIGLVQDIWDAEIFLALSSNGETGILTELSTHNQSENDAGVQLAERHPIYLVSVPGETDWARGIKRPVLPNPQPSAASQQNQPTQNKPAQRKRTRDDADMDDNAPSSSENGSSSGATPTVSTPAPSILTMPTPPSGARPPLPVPRGTDKRARQGMSESVEQSGSASNPAALLGLNTPDVRGATAVVAKLYTPSTVTSNEGSESQSVETPSLNSVVEVVGILQDAPTLSSSNESTEDLGFASEHHARNPRNVRRIHVVQWRTLPEQAGNPLLTRSGAIHNLASARSDAAMNASRIRNALLSVLRRVLYNDALAAEYMLMALLARPIRTNSQILGKLSVNLVMPAKPTPSTQTSSPSLGVDGANITKVLKLLCPRVVDIDVSIASMNCTEVYARKDYDLNRLRAGRLQVAPGTCVVIDETRLTNGQLSERGVKNVHALRSLATRAVTPVDFKFYETNMDFSGSVLLVSQGGKSIVGGDVVVRVQPQYTEASQHQETQVNLNDISDEELDMMRLGLSLLAENGQFDISQEASDDVSQVYVDARKAGRAKDGQESLQRWLCVARCVARSFGESKLSLERWKHALSLEQSREGRMASPGSS